MSASDYQEQLKLFTDEELRWDLITACSDTLWWVLQELVDRKASPLGVARRKGDNKEIQVGVMRLCRALLRWRYADLNHL